MKRLKKIKKSKPHSKAKEDGLWEPTSLDEEILLAYTQKLSSSQFAKIFCFYEILFDNFDLA